MGSREEVVARELSLAARLVFDEEDVDPVRVAASHRV